MTLLNSPLQEIYPDFLTVELLKNKFPNSALLIVRGTLLRGFRYSLSNMKGTNWGLFAENDLPINPRLDCRFGLFK